MAKVMLVEDDNNLREIYEARMQAEGYDVVSAKDGEEALVVAKAEKPELIISDVMMPKISGFEMLDILRNTEGMQAVKVIMLTALGQADDQQRADRLGADRYLVKSQVTLEDIVNVAHQLLGDTAEPEVEVPAAVATPAPVAEPVAPIAVATPPALSPDPVVPSPVPVTPIVTQSATPVAIPPVAAVEPVVALNPAPTSGFSAVQVEPPTTPVVPVSPAAPVSLAAPSNTVSDDAQSAAQEEAAVEAQIESFVSGTPQAVAVAPEEVPTPVPVPPPAIPIATPSVISETAAETSAADDKVLANAVDVFSGATTAPQPVVETAPITPAPGPVVTTSGVAGKKVISPLSGASDKPDLNTLLAQEAAKEQMIAVANAPVTSQPEQPAAPVGPEAAPAAVNPPVVAPPLTPTPVAPIVESAEKPDPNSISL